MSGKTDLELGQLFLPSSRSGLQLLYKHYFAGDARGNLVMPVKDFLRFLQLYAEYEQLQDSRRNLLEFGEEHLLQGKVVQKDNETFYVDRQGGRAVPLYVASSMIHELTPFIKALSAAQRIDWLYCDEVENSLHPLLQGEMARWLIRMVNAGMYVIVSTHSDTMASRLNNLLMLTRLNQSQADYKMLSELELMKADLLCPDMKASVYEFRNGQQGKTVVEELEFISHPLMGYDLDLASKDIDRYCEQLRKALEGGNLVQIAEEACEKFENISEKWISLKGQKYKYGIKDSVEFRSFLMKEIYGVSNEQNVEKMYAGYVLNVSLDKRNMLFGFIRHEPDNIFFHEFDNPDMDRSYVGKRVSYKIICNGDQKRAINVKLVES